MATNLDELDAEVNALTVNIFRFRDTLGDIQEASKTDVDTEALSQIVSRFRGKIPNQIDFKRISADARDVAMDLGFADLETRLAHISARNDVLSQLTSELDTQVAKANSDATLLTRIKDGVDKATKTVDELKSLVSQLTATDATTKSRIASLLESLGNLSSILHPET
jgi:methyl-accepting chemotaxis protein